MVERKTKATMKETLRLLEKTTSALELTRKENEVLGLKLEKTHRRRNREERKRRRKRRNGRRRRRRRHREVERLCQKLLRSRRSFGAIETKRREGCTKRKEHIHFGSLLTRGGGGGGGRRRSRRRRRRGGGGGGLLLDDFYSDDDDDNEEDTTTSSSSSSPPPQKTKTTTKKNTSGAPPPTTPVIPPSTNFLDRSVVLNSRLEALEQRARHLATASSKTHSRRVVEADGVAQSELCQDVGDNQ